MKKPWEYEDPKMFYGSAYAAALVVAVILFIIVWSVFEVFFS